MIEKITLPNGVRILYEQVPSVRSCALGVWVESGSRHEPEELGGISHYIEHMLFKGTESRTAAQLATAFDAIGGQVNAFTTKENTCYYARVLDTHIQEAADLLCDMYFHSRFGQQETDLERGVILEEIGMYEDTPDDLVIERLSSAIYKGSSLGRPILGTRETLEKIQGTTLRDYCSSRYSAANTVVSVAGSFTMNDIEQIARRFEKMPGGEPLTAPQAVYQPSFTTKTKDIEQNHLCLAFPGIAAGSPDRYRMQVLSNILGGGMSSRLFQRVREQRGLCYTIYSFSSAHRDTGYFGIYTALGRSTEMQALELIGQEVRAFAQEGPTEEEVQRSVEQLKSSALMSLESMNSRMNANARGEFLYGHPLSAEDIIRGYDAVTRDGVHQLAQELFKLPNASFSAVGKVSSQEEYQAVIRAALC